MSIKEQKLNNLVEAVTDLKDYWLGLNKNTEETLDGFIFSLFSMIDGESGSNDFHHLIIKDKGTILNNDNYLHELWVGYCEEENKLIVVADMSEEKYFGDMDEKAQETYRKKTLRHEIMHAFLNESGLSDSSNRFDSAWAKNEEMVDWLAIQAPKIFSAFKKMNIL